jgi:hypothetical protein
MASWGQGTEKGVEIIPWNNLFEDINSFGDFFTVFLKLDVMEVEIKDIPGSCVVSK